MLINRQDAIDAILILKHKPEFNSANSIRDCYVLTEAEEVIKHIPSAERKGKWILHLDHLFPLESTMECNQCHKHHSCSMIYTNYCPNCGASMVKGENDERID